MDCLKVSWELIQGADGKKHLNMYWNVAQTQTPIRPEG
jgi:hypothetical protein